MSTQDDHAPSLDADEEGRGSAAERPAAQPPKGIPATVFGPEAYANFRSFKVVSPDALVSCAGWKLLGVFERERWVRWKRRWAEGVRDLAVQATKNAESHQEQLKAFQAEVKAVRTWLGEEKWRAFSTAPAGM